MPRSDTRAGSGYGRLDRLLHRIALGSAPILELSFDIEQARHGRAADAIAMRPPVFVAGLARAGTTIAMQLLHAADDFAALAYRDLPFALAPNSWAGVSAGWKRGVEARERGHGDGMLHDLDSPEAIEEVFWRTHEGSRYLGAAGLSPVAPEAETLAAFERYVRLVCLRYGRDRYLSKNNNNVLRLAALAAQFPDAVLVHPFRDPAEQSLSLLAQHRRACALAAGDRFRGDFMRWLGHHEFGAHHRPFLLPPGEAPSGDPETPDYWLRLWIGVHRHLLDQPEAVARSQHFLDYDRLAAGDSAEIVRLQAALALVRPIDGTGLRPAAPHAPTEPIDPVLLDEARGVHAALAARAA